MGSRLADAVSPYLRAHAGNPVDWWPWGEAAFAEAEARQVPVFVSIGYATCHWCHVMARESFSDPDLAAYLNEHFVAIKVDREEHPDVDASYLAAAGAFTQNLGWPLSVFATPAGAAFFAGTYFPPTAVGQVPSFREVLEAIVDAWRDERGQLEGVGSSLVEALAALPSRSAPDDIDMDAALATLQRLEDPEFGGLGRGSKFPNAPVLGFLLEAGDRAFATRSLDVMARSELRDPVDGGFFRYTVQRDWTEPHYERMLSDNAQLLDIAAAVGDRDVASGIAGFLLGTLRLPGGAFASAQDSESILDGVRNEGGWYRLDADGRAAQPAPSLDAKVLTGINGLAIGALAGAGARFDRPDWVAAAAEAADAVLSTHRLPDRLIRASLDGRPSEAPATLEDYGGLAGGLLRLALAAGEPRFAAAGRELVEACADGVPGGPDPVLAARGLALAGEASDGAVPSGPALLADAALRLWGMTGDARHRDLAERSIVPALAEAVERPSAFGAALRLAAQLRRPQRQLVVVGPADAALEDVARTADADVLSILGDERAAAFADDGFELFEGRSSRHGRETAYWCRQFVCALPVTDAGALSTLLSAAP